ncbi:MAG: hypothetical protein V5A32_03045 [Halovenus sp.]
MTTTTTTTATPGELLTNRRRRYVLYCLQRYAGPVPLAEIADQITVWETGCQAEKRPKRRLQTYNSLYHEHVPTLQDVNIVDYDQEGDLVVFNRDSSQVETEIQRAYQDECVDLLGAECRAFEGEI